jgi:chromosome segregation ATPase
LRKLVNAQEAELFRLRAEVQETESALAESIQEVQILRQDLEDAKVEQHRLEDELELQREELETMHNQIRESHKSKSELRKLAESEVFCSHRHAANALQQQRLLEEKEAVVKSNSELYAQLKALRNNLQLGKSRDTSRPSNDKDETDSAECPSLTAAIREKDRLIDSLRLELADLEVRLAEQSSTALLGTRQVEDALLQVKLENIRLAENVESYQMLLQDRILKGEYPIMSLEGVPERDEVNSVRSNSPSHEDEKSKSASLATELEEAEISATTSKIKGMPA